MDHKKYSSQIIYKHITICFFIVDTYTELSNLVSLKICGENLPSTMVIHILQNLHCDTIDAIKFLFSVDKESDLTSYYNLIQNYLESWKLTKGIL